ncbi:MAG: hypothetical protein KF726_19860 [Anaerolineae bacterium]|nr:hypothetical protein [Anaerolineae bacterium]
MTQVTCINISGFRQALSYGKTYDVLAIDHAKRHVKISGDNKRVRWYPLYHFQLDDPNVLRVENIHIDDKIDSMFCDSIEVTLVLSKGADQTFRRWCVFITPAYLYKLMHPAGSEPVIIGKHGLFLPQLTPTTIEQAVKYLEFTNLLEECTLPLDDHSDVDIA